MIFIRHIFVIIIVYIWNCLTSPYNLDYELSFTRKNFASYLKQRIHLQEKPNMSKKEKLDLVKPFPDPYVFAILSSDVYYPEESVTSLPMGWEILTSSESNSGYFGRAYWNPESKQVVIAHRGTSFTDFKDWIANGLSIGFNQYSLQMNSAMTFVQRIVELLAESESKLGYRYQLFFTGHSLGGWLAQIATFTAKYLTVKDENFVLNQNYSVNGYHAHTVVFDSPGCRSMIDKMISTFHVRYGKQAISSSDLDITSYLSAPNSVNTIGNHAGRILRLFFDEYVENMWFSTLYYTIFTHSINEIVKALTLSTKAPKIIEVVDWPHRMSSEYGEFHRNVNESNEFHIEPDLQKSKENKTRIRYETVDFKDNECRKSVFTKSELKFVQAYYEIRNESTNLEDFFPETLAAATKLKKFRFENGMIVFESNDILKDFIPYVKTFLQLYPDVKNDIEEYAKQDRILMAHFLHESDTTSNKIARRELDFKYNTQIEDFLKSKQGQIFQLNVNEDPSIRMSTMFAAIQKHKHLKRTSLFYSLEQFLNMDKKYNFKNLLNNTYINLVIVECKQFNNQEKEMLIALLRGLLEVVKHKSDKKIVFTIHENLAKTFDEIYHETGYTPFNWYIKKSKEFSWNELTTETQERLMMRPVEFQGRKQTLNTLLNRSSIIQDLLDSETVLKLSESSMKIGRPNEFKNETFHIERSLIYRKNIKKEVLTRIDEHGKKLSDLFIISGDSHPTGYTNDRIKFFRSEDEAERIFNEMCRKFDNVIWFSYSANKDYLELKKSKKSISLLRWDLIDNQIFSGKKFLKATRNLKTVIISDKAGMGKSTILAHYANLIINNANNSGIWVIRINLNDHTEKLQDLKKKSNVEEISIDAAIGFVQDQLLKIQSNFERKFFRLSFYNRKVILMLDGFDEISPYYDDVVIKLMSLLASTQLKQLWITTRSHKQSILEDELQQFAHGLEPFSKENQIEFLTNYWEYTLCPCDENEKAQIIFFSESLVNTFSKSISDHDTEITGIPLQSRMLAEIFQDDCKKYIKSAENYINFAEIFSLNVLYEKFIEKKFEIYWQEKSKRVEHTSTSIEQKDSSFEYFKEKLQDMAIFSLFNQSEAELLLKNKLFYEFRKNHKRVEKSLKNITELKENLFTELLENFNSTFVDIQNGKENLGIITNIVENKPVFIHRTFAEYFASMFLANQIILNQDENMAESDIADILYNTILSKKEHRGIRAFLNKQIVNKTLNLNMSIKRIMKDESNKENFKKGIYYSAEEGSTNLIKTLVFEQLEADTTDLFGKECIQEGLIIASEYGQIMIVRHFIEIGADISQKSENGWTALTYASNKGHYAVVEYLVEKGANIHEKVIDGRTALHLASYNGHLAVVKYLVKKGANIDEKDVNSRTALHRASYNGHIDVVKYLVKKGANIDEKVIDGRTALHLASYNGHLAVVKYLVKKGANIDEKDVNSRTALHRASYNGHLTVVKYLVKNGANIDENDVNRRTALHSASYNGHFTVVKYLVKKGVNIDEKDNEGNTALYLASCFGHLAVVEYLIKKGANIYEKDNEGNTALYLAGYNGHLSVVEYLVEKGANIDEKVIDGRTALHSASYNGHLTVVKYLVTNGVNIDERDNQGNTALYLASYNGHLSVVEYLVEKGANIHEKDVNSRTALHRASRNGHLTVVEYLVAKGASIE